MDELELHDVKGEATVGTVGVGAEQLPEEEATAGDSGAAAAGDSGAAHWSFFTAEGRSAWSCRTPANCIFVVRHPCRCTPNHGCTASVTSVHTAI